MKISENWIKEYVALPTATLCEQLTDLGLEVESVTPRIPPFSGVVSARIEAASPHPNADKLKVCRVFDGKDTHQVVCGAANAREGIIVAFAKVGAVLSPNIHIKAALLRGTESFGMLCSQKELGLASESNGIMELPQNTALGLDLFKEWDLADNIIECKITPDRGDCLSVKGFVRELQVKNHFSVTFPSPLVMPSERHEKALNINVQDADACPLYYGRLFYLDKMFETPRWMIERLARSGIGSINGVVDICNYVMLEIGQPLHAFDRDKLQGDIHVRFAKPKESLTLLNGQTATLTEETLIIADSKNPLAIAGVMGGLSSAVTEDTRTIFVESAYFSARLIRGKSRLYGLHTESSYRFERGIDEKMTSTAIDRVTELLVSLGHAVIGEKSIYCNAPYFTQRQKSLSLSSQKLNKVLGYAIALKKAKAILLQLGCELMTETAEIIEIMPPSHRHDLLNPEDLIHEIVRIDGYDKIPESPLLIEAAMPVLDPRAKAIREIKHFFASLGYAETVTYAFNEGKLTNEKTAIRLKNPLTRHLSVMRDNLIESLLMAQSYNEARQMQDIRLFEMGRVYSHSSSSQRKIGKANFNNGFAVGLEHSERWHVSAIPLGSSGPMDPRLRGGDGEIHQPLYIAGLWVGQALPTQWEASSTGVDFYTIKGHLESYFESQGNMNITYRPSEHSLFHPTQSADIFYKDHLIGVVGRLHPKLVAEYKLKNPPYLFEVQLEALLENKPIIYAPISPYPMVSRDLAFVMDENFSYEALEKAVRSVDVDCQLQIDLFDIYRGDKILHHQKSLAIRLQFSSLTKTLTEDMINGWVGQIINAVETQCGAILRGA